MKPNTLIRREMRYRHYPESPTIHPFEIKGMPLISLFIADSKSTAATFWEVGLQKLTLALVRVREIGPRELSMWRASLEAAHPLQP